MAEIKGCAELKARLTFTEEVLGTASSDPNIHDGYIASLAPDAQSREEEVAALGAADMIAKATSVFARDAEGRPSLWDYQIKGFFKDACSMLARLSEKGEDGKKRHRNESGKLTAYRKVIDGLIFVGPRMIPIRHGGGIGTCQRPLRASTAQGERIALANSETLPAGAYIDVAISMLDAAHEPAVREWLDYGRLRGIGQWRNSGKGRFEWALLA